jgi:cell division transport system permease protein
MYLMKLALRPWRVAPWSQLVSALAVGFLFMLVGLSVWIWMGLDPVIDRLKNEQVITAYIDPSIDPKAEQKTVDQIHLSLGAHAVADVQVVQPEEFIKTLKGSYPDLARELEDLGPETTTLVPRYVSIAGILPPETLENIKAVPGIESAESSRDRYSGVIGGFTTLKTMLFLLTGGLLFALLTGLTHLSRLNVGLMADAVSIMKLLGASQWSMRGPAMLSGLFVGAAGGLCALIGWMTLGMGLSRHIRELSVLLRDVPQAPVWLGAALLLASALTGFLAAGLGTFFNVGVSRATAAAGASSAGTRA